MKKFSLGIDAKINGIYLNSETIEMLSIIQCSTIEELKDFVRNCSQLNINEEEIEKWNENDLENIKRNIVEQYKETIIPMEQGIKDKRSVLRFTLKRSGIAQDEIESYISLFQEQGYERVKQKLKAEHPESYAFYTQRAHRFISSERDQIKSVSYEELSGINDILQEYNTILIASGRYYDVTSKMYDEQISDMKKHDFYYAQRGLNFCYKNKMHARYHTLLDKQTLEKHLRGRPKDEVIKELQEFVKQSIDFITKYNEEHKINGKGVITSVDLFNEIISFDPPYRNMWEELYGITNEELVSIFQYALDNKPEGITYVYNEPFLENKERRDAVLKQLKQVNSICPGLIDTIGTQMHIEMTQNAEDVRQCFEDLKQSGFNVQITEFDMCLPESLMFDRRGKVRSEEEIIEIINKKTGMLIGSLAELKEMRMAEITKAIKSTGVSLEGVTYWSISDTLDHNLERTNKKIFEQGLQRDIATTRYAGLYSDFNKEKERLTEEFDKLDLNEKLEKASPIKKNTMISFISKILNKIKQQIVKRKKEKMLPESSQIIEEKSIINKSQREKFSESIRVSLKGLGEKAKKQRIKNVETKQQDKNDGPNRED